MEVHCDTNKADLNPLMYKLPKILINNSKAYKLARFSFYLKAISIM